jgi:hypothetical protein
MYHDRPVRIVYAICRECAARCGTDPGFGESIEDRLIARCRAGTVDKRWSRQPVGRPRFAGVN